MLRYLMALYFVAVQLACIQGTPASELAGSKSCSNRGVYHPCTVGSDGSLNDCLPAKTIEDWIIFRTSADTSRLRSRTAWQACLHTEGCTPLGNYEHAIVERFNDGLRFDEGGLIQSDYREIASVLTLPEIQAVFSAFGIGVRLLEENSCNQIPETWCLWNRSRERSLDEIKMLPNPRKISNDGQQKNG